TFWVSVPAKTEQQRFFEFLQQQGYLRVWIDNEVVRVDDDPKKINERGIGILPMGHGLEAHATKIKRLGARVQVIQDRIEIADKNRARLVEALETALRFGKGKVNVISISENAQRSTLNAQRPTTSHLSPVTNHEFPFSTGWHCAHCDLDIRQPSPGLFSFNNPLGACPECRGFGRTVTIDLNKAIPDRSLSIIHDTVRVLLGSE